MNNTQQESTKSRSISTEGYSANKRMILSLVVGVLGIKFAFVALRSLITLIRWIISFFSQVSLSSPERIIFFLYLILVMLLASNIARLSFKCYLRISQKKEMPKAFLIGMVISFILLVTLSLAFASIQYLAISSPHSPLIHILFR